MDMYNFVHSLVVIKGIGKNKKEYKLLAVDRNSRFNPGIVALALEQGVREIDVTGKK